ncbi:MAG TPA: hypothetical protein VMT18_14970, partial [Planctomycetota bacterium]|nr:hypothetical protein [Planctomycetota bacterium]
MAAGNDAPGDLLASVALQAGEDAYRVSAWSEAARYFEAAAAARSAAPKAMAQIQLRAAQAHYRNLDVERSRERFMDAIEGFRGSDEYMGWAEALVGWIRSQISHGGVPIGEMLKTEMVDEFLEAMGDRDGRARARVLAEWAEVLFNAQRPAEAMAMAGQALEIGEAAGDDFVSVHATDTMALALYLDLRPAEALAYHQRAEAHAMRHGDPWLLGWPLQRIPLCLFALGHLAEASTAAERAGELAEAVHDWAENSMNLAVRAALAMTTDNFVDCERFAARSLLMLDRSTYGWTPGILFPGLAQARMMQGQTGAAADAVDLWRQRGARGPAWLLDQLVQVTAGRSDAVRAEIEQNPQRAFRRDAADAFGLGALAARAQLARDLGLPDLAQFSQEGLATAYGRGVRFTLGGGVFLVPRLLGELAGLAGDEAGAAEYFDAAVRDADACGALPELGQTHLSWARLLAEKDQGNSGKVASHLSRAVAIFTDLGMAQPQAAARSLAREHGLAVAPPGAGELPDSLDALDIEIIAQRARGRQMAEIATATMLAERTVAHRLDALAVRLGITSALAARDYLDRAEIDSALSGASARTSARLGPDRSLRVVMVADIVESTATNVRLGDEGWNRILEVHDAIVRDALARQGGMEVKHTGDGVLATFVSTSAA